MQEAHDRDETPRRADEFLSGGGEMGARMRSQDWSNTPFGPVETWPQSLRTAISLMLASRFAMVIAWGPDFRFFYNDRYRPVLGASKHPGALGAPARDIFPEAWPQIGPLFESTRDGQSVGLDDLLVPLDRYGYLENCYFTLSYSPIRDESGGVGGMLAVVAETTERVQGERRLKTLRDLARRASEAKTAKQACLNAGHTLGENPINVPFALLYLLDRDGKTARLECASGLAPGTAASPGVVNLAGGDDTGWPLDAVVRDASVQVLDDLPQRFGPLPAGPYEEPTHSALLVPLLRPGQRHPDGILVFGVSPRRALDDQYRAFFELAADHTLTAIRNALAYQEEREKAERLAELDRAKTIFFSNVSHEFRTPLTLMLGPLEAAVSAALDPNQRQELEIVYRNGLRLQKLVNTLLDFSRIEAGRIQAIYEPTDLAAYTAELASVFRSTVERVGMQLIVNCPPLAEPIYVNREMWEKVVLNLLSNAFKFTFEGAISVSLHPSAGNVELRVNDTGTGIPEAELPHLFERFHRIRGAKARTHEGTGIGLALVQELVRLHGGSIDVESEFGKGATFTVSIPTGSAHLPADRIGAERAPASTMLSADTYVEEALRWIPDEAAAERRTARDLRGESQTAADVTTRILLADDNADMREYVSRILSHHWAVEAVADGSAALEAARERIPNLVIADVMMPGLDGFELLSELRADPRTREVPVILLSARAGEESRVEGLEAGADDYLTKPFSAKELVACVGGHLQMARIRSEANNALRESEAQLQVLFDEAPLGVYLVADDFRIRQVNPMALPTFGNIPDLIGRDFDEVIHILWSKEYADEIVRLFRRTLETGEPYFTPERIEERLDSGVTEYYEWQINRIPLPEGRYGVVCYFRDISAQVFARQERERLLAAEREARATADAASRAKDEFLATVSHELRNPLNAMLGWARVLSGGSLNDETATRGLRSIEQNAKAQAQLIEDLLDVSRIISGKFRLNVEPIQVGRVIEAAIESMRPAADAKGVRLQAVLDPDAGPVSGDAGRLQQVVWNLLSNAVKFTPRGGQVQARLTRVNSHVEIVVSDTGQGIATEFLPYMFDRFRQADGSSTRSHGGLGLGLAIVRHIVELHGGSVTADSPGKDLGATFTVKLPLIAIHAKSTVEQRLHPGVKGEMALHFTPSLSLEGVRVLVVNDEAETLLLLSTVLTQSGAYVKSASSAEEGFREVQAWRPDVIVSDIGMPGEDGYAFMKRVKSWSREAGAWIPAVALTAYARAEDRMKAMASGFQMHVPKPVEPAELITVIASLVERPPTPWNAAP